eukprot:CAMPEP_0119378590 /NCGR_PEP_ID=MMETSP1334-20130426/49021_1 /TAXON_ID=127549 /ORGANISM="Calcidiscus leptoporus, Strain RCC1130" /LENGTH=90 /DNA_ID=CAMNT_0007397855 /DNA_START=241 /DNA_END=510 /DNA_ORIENTATION=+
MHELVSYCDEVAHLAHKLVRERSPIVSSLSDLEVQPALPIIGCIKVELEQPFELFGRTNHEFKVIAAPGDLRGAGAHSHQANTRSPQLPD